MSSIDVIMTLILNMLPIVILAFIYLFLRKKLIGKFYYRVLIGIIVFYLLYWVLPLIFQLQNAPKELSGGDAATGINYIIAHFGSLIALFGSYPLVTLPFIFFVSPFISIIFIWNRLRKEEGTLKENLRLLSYQLNDSPIDVIKKSFLKSDWSREKEILKLLIVLLPVSLYLLQVILTVSGLETLSLTTGETALGWFLEILFVYLATFIFSIELLSSSQIALKGKHFGENIRNQVFKSLYTVGAPISILSIILYVVQYFESLPIIIYFFAYFIMASIIFVLFLNFFEPFSILLFVRIINWWKNKKERIKQVSLKNVIYPLTYGFLSFVAFLLLNVFVFSPIFVYLFPDPMNIVYSAKFDQNQTLFQALSFDLMNIFTFATLIIVPLLITTISLKYSLKKMSSQFMGFFVYLALIIVISSLFSAFSINGLINFASDEYWITGQTSYTGVFGFLFYTLRTAGLEANLSGFLGFLSIPYIYTRYIFNIIIWGLLLIYLGKTFKVKNIPIDDKTLEKMVFSTLEEFIPFDDYIKGKNYYLISRAHDITMEDLKNEREEIRDLFDKLETDLLINDLIPSDTKEKQRFYFTLKYLFNKGYIDIYRAEFGYTFEKVEKQGLYIIYEDGRGVFDYSFKKDYLQDPGLISGMFSAITSFIKETTHSEDLLKTIDHGDITILIEYGKKVFGALFIKGKQTADLRMQLKEFVQRFEQKYASVLEDWSGALSYFKEDEKLVEEIFKEE